MRRLLPAAHAALLFLASIALLCPPASAAPPAPAERPNVLFILADDLGWRDLGSYGSDFYETPNIDALVAKGLKFTNAHTASPLCSPTRASILTGLHPARIGFTAPRGHHAAVVLEQGLLGGRPELPWHEADTVTRLHTGYLTMPELFKEAGYRTGHFGKWHLGREPHSPLEHGYDVDVPHWYGSGPPGRYTAPFKNQDHAFADAPAGAHIEDLTAEAALEFVKDAGDDPWFASYWAFSVHGPWDQEVDVKPNKLETYIERIQPAPDGDIENAQRRPVMGAMIEVFDDNVGRLMEHLESSGQLDRTIVVFFSDNGGAAWRAPEKHGWSDRPITSNFPLRGGKTTIYEGGTRVPLAILWPGRTRAGTETDALVSSVDMLPTLATMAGLPLPAKPHPEGLDGHGGAFSDGTLDGVDFSPVLHGERFDRTPLFVHFPHGRRGRPGYQPSSSLQDGDWKLIRFYADLPKGAPRTANPVDRHELYDLSADLGETNDLSEENPAKLAEMIALLDERLHETGAVIPTANPGYAGRAASSFERFTHEGWRVHKDAQGSTRGGRLMLDGFGADPYLVCDAPPAVEGELVLTVRMKADAGEKGCVYWQTRDVPDFKSNRAYFDAPVGEAITEVSVPFEADSPLTVLRLDPTDAVAAVEIDWIRLARPDGEELARWDF